MKVSWFKLSYPGSEDQVVVIYPGVTETHLTPVSSGSQAQTGLSPTFKEFAVGLWLFKHRILSAHPPYLSIFLPPPEAPQRAVRVWS